MGWRFGKTEVVRYKKFWQVAQKHLWRMTRVVFQLVFISDRSVASSSVHFSYKNHSLSLISLLFAENTLSERVRHLCQRSVCSTPASFDLIRSLFSLVSNFFHSLCFFFFHLSFSFFKKNLYMAFYAPSPFPNPSVLGSVTTCRQCLVCQVTSRSSVMGRVTKKCTRRVIEIQMIWARKGVRLPLPCPQKMWICRWLNQRKVLMTVKVKELSLS